MPRDGLDGCAPVTELGCPCVVARRIMAPCDCGAPRCAFASSSSAKDSLRTHTGRRSFLGFGVFNFGQEFYCFGPSLLEQNRETGWMDQRTGFMKDGIVFFFANNGTNERTINMTDLLLTLVDLHFFGSVQTFPSSLLASSSF